ncbi:MAG: hypothetical protein LBM70_07325 [Victivallales bacterium]|jgi:hypothetical protein|nr:hypothetical protein [Victivallales bacterium]
MKKSIGLVLTMLTMGITIIGADNLSASAENFNPGKVFKLVDGKICNNTMYAGDIICNIAKMSAFAADFKVKLLPKTNNESGHFSVSIDVVDAKWTFVIYSDANGNYSINRLHIPNSKTVSRKYFKPQALPSELFKDALGIKVEFNDEVFKITFADQTFEQNVNAESATLSFASYRQPVEISDLKIEYKKASEVSQP